jgi:hypothetical protein
VAVGWGSLVKPTVFTVTFGASAFGLASVWQYETMRANVLQQRANNPVKNFWCQRYKTFFFLPDDLYK